MKKQLQEIAKGETEILQEKKISRKEAIKKTGYIAISAATMMILLSNPAQAGPGTSHDGPAPPPSNPPSNGGNGIWKKK